MDKTWWLYWGVIPPGWFMSTDILQPATAGRDDALDRPGDG
jgi:hypothetical protein